MLGSMIQSSRGEDEANILSKIEQFNIMLKKRGLSIAQRNKQNLKDGFDIVQDLHSTSTIVDAK